MAGAAFSCYSGLPEEFCPPRAAAAKLVAMSTLAERERFFGRIPPRWQDTVAHHAIRALALAIVAEPLLERRRALMREVPPDWQPRVKGFVVAFWRAPRAAERPVAQALEQKLRAERPDLFEAA